MQLVTVSTWAGDSRVVPGDRQQQRPGGRSRAGARMSAPGPAGRIWGAASTSGRQGREQAGGSGQGRARHYSGGHRASSLGAFAAENADLRGQAGAPGPFPAGGSSPAPHPRGREAGTEHGGPSRARSPPPAGRRRACAVGRREAVSLRRAPLLSGLFV